MEHLKANGATVGLVVRAKATKEEAMEALNDICAYMPVQFQSVQMSKRLEVLESYLGENT